MLLLISLVANGQSTSTLIGTKNAGMGYASATLANEWSLYNNIGTIADHRDLSAAMSYEISPTLPGGNRLAAVVSIPLGKGTIGAGIFRFGDDIYNEQVISIGYGNRLGLASLGIKVNYIQYRAEGFGTQSLFSVTLGGLARITPKFAIGAYVTNVNQAKISEASDERLPTEFVLGLQFKPIKKLVLAIEVEKDLEYDVVIKGGVSYNAFKKIWISTGFNIDPNAIFFGIDYQVWRLSIGYAAQYNFRLSLRNQASISYRIRSSKKT